MHENIKNMLADRARRLILALLKYIKSWEDLCIQCINGHITKQVVKIEKVILIATAGLFKRDMPGNIAANGSAQTQWKFILL
jgi:hypothetical protein